MRASYSLYKIQDAEKLQFCPIEYSRFKYGDAEIATNFGKNLAIGFIREHLYKSDNQIQIVVISSPYSFIPTATYALKTAFVYELNKWLSENSRSVVQETKVHRNVTYKEDYGELDAEQRMHLISNDYFHIDAEFVKGKTLLFLDDIKITGSHERMIIRMINTHQLLNDIYLLYFAELVNLNIHPNFENRLNYSFVRSIFDLQTIIESKKFLINTRVVKYILNYNNIDFAVFLSQQTAEFRSLLLNMAIGNGYHTIQAYSINFHFLKASVYNKQNNYLSYGN